MDNEFSWIYFVYESKLFAQNENLIKICKIIQHSFNKNTTWIQTICANWCTNSGYSKIYFRKRIHNKIVCDLLQVNDPGSCSTEAQTLLISLNLVAPGHLVHFWLRIEAAGLNFVTQGLIALSPIYVMQSELCTI